MISFEVTGKLSVGKETEKFKPFEEKEYSSGWVNRTIRFNATSGTNRLMMQVKGGAFKDGHGMLYLYSKDYVDANGKKVKGEPFTIPFGERFNPKHISNAAEWKKFVIDLEVSGRRWKLENALEKSKEGHEFSESELRELGVFTAADIESELEKSKKKRKEFLSEYDFAEFLNTLLRSDKYKDKKFVVRGTYEMQYSEDKQRWYSNYVPNRIYLAADDAEETATANVVLFYDSSSLIDATEEKGRYYVNGYVQVYDNNRKQNVFAPYTVVIKTDDNEKKVKKIVSLFTVDEGVKELGMVVNLLDGAQKTEITFESLSEDVQDNILCGLVEFEDVVKSLGGSIYGERITENRFTKLGRGYGAGRKDTVYSSEDFVIRSLNADDEDIFEDDDDLDLFS